jgi:leucyl aminopeptidase
MKRWRHSPEEFGATLTAIVGDDLLEQNYPMVHAVGRAAKAAPRFLELEWGDTSKPQLALVGKGVTFDSGGLDIKPGSGMRIMKKDMGGSAHVIALARLVMATKLPVHLKLYVPTVENAISGDAFRPGDILSSRKGLTVEIDNTDAEGRLILADALARASEFDPDLLIDFATLTGAARVALGADLAPVYSDDEQLVEDILAGSAESGDPVWRMPLWDPYLAELKSPIADLVNSGSSFGGSITAGLFLKQFVDAKSWAHFDVWAWRKGKYGRPEGAAACGLRAVWAMLQKRYR